MKIKKSDDVAPLTLREYAAHKSKGSWEDVRHLAYLSDVIGRLVVRGNARLIVSLPPRHGKTSLISQWLPAWYMELFPTRFVLLGMYEAKIARNYSRKVRATLRDEPDSTIELNEESQAVDFWHTIEDGGMSSAGVGGPFTGKGGDLIVIDDPIKNWEEAMSETYRQRVIDWFESVVYTRLSPGGSLIVVMTRWHEDDLIGYLLRERKEEWTHIRLPAIAEENDPLGRNVGDALWPQRYPIETLKKIRTSIGPRRFEGLYQQSPSAQSGTLIRRDYIRRYDSDPTLHQWLMSWDMSFKDEKDSSYTVGQVWGRKGANVYLVDQVRERVDFVGALRMFQNLVQQYPQCRAKLVEETANGPAVISALKKRIPGIVPIKPKDSKVARVQSVLPYFEAGNVYVPRAEWADECLEEWFIFPNGRHEDQVDAMSQALAYFAEHSSESVGRIESFGELLSTHLTEV